MTEVTRSDRVIELKDSGLSGKDGLTGDFLNLIQTNESGNNVQAQVVQSGALFGPLTTFSIDLTYETEGESLDLEIAGLNDGDPRQVQYAGSNIPVNPSTLTIPTTIQVRGMPLGDGFSHFALVGPGIGPAPLEDVLSGTGQGSVTPGTLMPWGEAARAGAGRVAYQGSAELVTASKPGRVEMVDPTRMLHTIRPNDDDYRDGYVRDYTDHVEFEWRNLRGIYEDVAADSWVLCSIASVFDGLRVEHANFAWDRIVGSSTNNGQIFSMFDAIQFGGKASDAPATISALGGSGPGHHHYDQTTNALLVTGGVKNGAVIPNGTDVQATLKPGEIINFSQFDIVGNRTLQGPGGFTFANVNMLRRMGGGAQLLMNEEVAFVSSEPVGLTVGTGFNCCYRKANRMQGRSGPATVSAVADVGLRDNHVVTFPNAWRVTGWKDTSVGHALDIEQPDTYRPFRRNGVQVAHVSANDPLMIDEATGPKVRQYSCQGSTTFDAETGNTLGFLSYLKAVRANGA